MFRLYRNITIIYTFFFDTTWLFSLYGFRFGSQQQCYREVLSYLFSGIFSISKIAWMISQIKCDPRKYKCMFAGCNQLSQTTRNQHKLLGNRVKCLIDRIENNIKNETYQSAFRQYQWYSCVALEWHNIEMEWTTIWFIKMEQIVNSLRNIRVSTEMNDWFPKPNPW